MKVTMNVYDGNVLYESDFDWKSKAGEPESAVARARRLISVENLWKAQPRWLPPST